MNRDVETGHRPTIVVAVDAMGGDHGPAVVVPGVLDALADRTDLQVRLYGLPDPVAAALGDAAGDPRVTIVPCLEDIEMGEAPAAAIRNRPDSPIVRAMRDHRAGEVQAVVSAGSTGAMVAGSLMLLGRLDGVDRPAIATVVPTLEGHFLLLDAGANVQCCPEHLHCFARMGRLFGAELLQLEAPRVGLLNIGEEPSKGTELCVAAHQLMSADPDLGFVGNVESRNLLLGAADVVVTDGFTGNMVLKLIEGFGGFLQRAARKLAAGGAAGGGGLRDLLGHMDYEEYGGAMLLGVRGTPIIAHGTSSSRAIANAVRVGARLAARGVPDRLAAAVAPHP
ncbi:MAG TPA: phosphate acyltransferase PlsX [Candidatus Krumholzibacteria bacterium]|nr:phosphate acyltransferase PlsX [Candidatus Krumholzibacteria bacterium]HRX50695.1 phosphate acyltransferase PlsX [Candidatus Krumholzibacteria bacterium]